MCGIAGCVVPEGDTPDRSALERMAAALGHRGPDDSGVEIVQNVGLAHARLSIVDPGPAGHQPMRHPGGRWWLTYNGEVFNHEEMRGSLSGSEWRGHSDTETLLHALAAWGEDAIPRCNGLYAYAALDLDRRRLLLVRDRFGVKPLYVARYQGAVWFASEMGALLAAGAPRRARRDVLTHSIVHGWSPGRVTPLEGIERVLPGTVVEVDLATLATSERHWYDPADEVDAERGAVLAEQPRAALRDALEAELRASVHRRLMADVPLGTMCSGGLDSSLVTAFAREGHPDVRAYNASIADQPEIDEGPWAERAARGLGVELRTVRMTGSDWRAALVEVVRHNEYPLMHESSVPMSMIAALAHADGVKVLLSGEAADELFAGYGFLHRGAYIDFLRHNLRVRPLVSLGWRKLREEGVTATVGRARGALADAATFRRARRSGGGPPDLDGAGAAKGFPSGSPDAVRYEHELRERAVAAYAYHEPTRQLLEGGLLGDLGTYLPHLLNRQDKNTMQRSIETRTPFLDPAVVELALNLPLEARLEPRRKGILRELGARHLPEGIAQRSKLGFGFDVRRYLEPAARREFLLDGALREELAVDGAAWRAVVDHAESHLALRLWSGEIWCRSILGGEDDAAVESALWRAGP